MDDMDMIFLYKDYLGDLADLSFLEGLDLEILKLNEDQVEIQGESLILKGE